MATFTRIRTSDDRTSTTLLANAWNSLGQHSVVDMLFGSDYQGQISTMSDEVHPGYKKLRARRTVILGSMNLERSDREVTTTNATFSASGWGTFTLTGDFATVAENLANFGDLPSSTPDGMKDETLAAAYAKVNSSAVLAGEFVHDIDQTLRMLRRPLKSSVELVRKMWTYRKKRVKKTARSAILASKDAWLEYRYGWKPLMMDADSIIQASNQRGNTWRRFVARAHRGDHFNFSDSYDELVSTLGLWVVGSSSLEIERRCDAGVIYEVGASQSPDLAARTLGLRLRDVPATVWEIIPYSFVVDWFVNVGDWIQAVVPVPGVNYLGNWVTDMYNATQVTNCGIVKVWCSAEPARWLSSSYGGGRIKSSSITRQINRELSSTPVLKTNMLTTLHFLDGAALAASSLIKGLGKLRH